jgi:hypothetical protein
MHSLNFSEVLFLSQRLVGAVTLLTLGFWVIKRKLGWLFWSFLLLHLGLYILAVYYARSVFDPFYPFTDMCLLCQTPHELWVTLGRLALWSGVGYLVLIKPKNLRRILLWVALLFAVLHTVLLFFLKT